MSGAASHRGAVFNPPSLQAQSTGSLFSDTPRISILFTTLTAQSTMFATMTAIPVSFSSNSTSKPSSSSSSSQTAIRTGAATNGPVFFP
ncbi:hypothetical protein L226DRAFT_571900 [Lentinus tigrinus ALCF2SS1-7]|uniref:Uncharacterized protein n=1 Tax=Lentinus tigrinus ALCF2SS1-6 TaxID=1328759 RepID=A0A5C2RYL1_9APHY|nr:hypothetical protein L227DRAFT_614746 [Lentinus tigrinus ALCF2SS1-6]RPD74021.1 hypothetical protein L226DRAFT_571900 [Lentinus tigrinus ALCF2SS1-7]